MSDAIEVEVNLITSGKIKYNFDRDINKVQDKAHPSTSQSSEERFDLMKKTINKLMEMISLDNNPNTREKVDFPPRNQRRPAVPWIRKRD
jgi:hypothetical protein